MREFRDESPPKRAPLEAPFGNTRKVWVERQATSQDEGEAWKKQQRGHRKSSWQRLALSEQSLNKCSQCLGRNSWLVCTFKSLGTACLRFSPL